MLPALPVTPNGKLDWRALPAPREQAAECGTMPRSPIEASVAEIWRSLPGVEATDVHAGFFESGGHSLLSTLLLARVRERFGVDVSLARFFLAPTIAGLAAAVEDAHGSAVKALPPLQRIPRATHKVRLGLDGEPMLPLTVRRQVLSAITGAHAP